jgi:hypothetical protein
LLLGQIRLAVSHPALDLSGAADGVDYAGELSQKAVARILDDPPPVLGDLWLLHYKGRPGDIKKIGEELGARYVGLFAAARCFATRWHTYLNGGEGSE